ncbi:MAG: HAD family hydrolase [Myxococcota bacterium]
MTNPRYRAAFFDFGGTLFSYQPLATNPASPVRASIRELGVELGRGEAGRAWLSASGEAFREYSPRPYYLHRDVFRESFARFARKVGAEPSDAWLDASVERQRVFLLEHFELRHDCLETLGQLRAAGLSLSIVSNIDDDYLDAMVPACGLDKVLQHWSSSEEAQSCKPDARFFVYALEKTGVEAKDVLFVGDSPEHDIAGATALGMTTALIRDAGSPPVADGAEPDHRIAELSELLAIMGVTEASSA